MRYTRGTETHDALTLPPHSMQNCANHLRKLLAALARCLSCPMMEQVRDKRERVAICAKQTHVSDEALSSGRTAQFPPGFEVAVARNELAPCAQLDLHDWNSLR